MNCEHLDKLVTVEPNTIDGCEEFLKIAGTWVHLRLQPQEIYTTNDSKADDS